MLSDELTILAVYGLYMALTLLAKVTGAATQLDMAYLMSSRDEHRTLKGMTARLDRALNNSVVAMALFAPAILILAARDQFSGATLMAAQVFLVARILYTPVYVFGIPLVRTLLWLAGFVATVLLYFMGL